MVRVSDEITAFVPRVRSRGVRPAGIALRILVLVAFAGVAAFAWGCGGSEEVVELYPVQVDDKWGYIDQTGEIVIEPQFDKAGVFAEGLAAVGSDSRVGYIDTSGEFQIQPQFANGGDFSGGPAPVSQVNSGLVGFVDTSGKMVVDFQYDDVAGFDEGLAPVKSEGKWGFIDQTGKLVIPCSFDDVGSFTDGLARIESEGKWGYVDSSGGVVIQPTYEGATPSEVPVMHFAEGLAAVKVDSEWVYVDKTGKTVIDKEFLAAGEFSEGLAPVIVAVEGKSGGYLGYIDKTGTMTIEPGFIGNSDTVNDSRLTGFHNGMAVAQPMDGELKGYIDTKGEWVIEPQFLGAYNFTLGSLALVTEKDGRASYIDRTGKVVFKGPAAESSDS
jgi:hypothetical protein